jgi:MoaA/NifB/PqqE/SkfB family radical SAM enzyme
MKNKNTFCIAAHRGFYLDSDKKVKPCCVFEEFDEELLFENSMSFDDVYNSTQFRNLRNDLDNGVVPNGCSKCFDGTINHRQNMNSLFFPDDIDVIDDMGLSETSEVIEYIDIRSSNYCNFKCRMCGPTYSTAWESDMKLLDKDFKPISDRKDDSWFSIIEDNIKNIKYFYMAGGEPFMMPEFEYLINKLSHRADEVHLFINTNLSFLKIKDKCIIDLIEKFKSINLFISCDGFGEIGEYQRTGFSTERFENNLNNLLNLIKNKPQFQEIQIIHVITAINVFDIFNFRNQLVDKFKLSDDVINFQFAKTPWYFSATSFSEEFKNNIYSFLNENLKDEFGNKFKEQINNFIYFLKNNKIENENLKQLDMAINLDSIRNTDIRKIAPWVVDDIWNRVKINISKVI